MLRRHLISVVLVLALAACAVAPQTPRDALGQAHILTQETVDTAQRLHLLRLTTPAQEQQLAELFGRVNVTLQAATAALTAGDETAAGTSLALVEALLLQARAILQEAQP